MTMTTQAWIEEANAHDLELDARECDDCGTTCGRHAHSCENYGRGNWQDDYVEDADRDNVQGALDMLLRSREDVSERVR